LNYNPGWPRRPGLEVQVMESLFRTALLLAAAAAAGAAAGAIWVGGAGIAAGGACGLLLAALALAAAGPLWLRVYRARAVDETLAPQLVRTVHELAARAGIAPPAVYLIDDPAPTALATGLPWRRSAVALSTGLLSLLSEKELRATVAHALAQVRRGDVRAVALGALLSGVVVALALAALVDDGAEAAGDDGAGMPGFSSAMFWLLAPLAALPLWLAAGRTRVFDADRCGACIAGDPGALADALYKIGRMAAVPAPVHRHPYTAPLLIAVPGIGAGWRRWLAGHPSTAERISRLRVGGAAAAADRRRAQA
jgi:heat shock protein HtpX